jgi:hypothetical protein
MAYLAKRDGIINENEIEIYITFSRITQIIKMAQDYPQDFRVNKNDIAFLGNYTDWMQFLEKNGLRYYGKIHDGNKAKKCYTKIKPGNDNTTLEAKKLTIDFFS